MGPDPQILKELVTMKMPFGKHKGKLIADLPESYLSWFKGEGFPKGRIGMLMGTCYEIKLNGLDYILNELKTHKSKK